MHGAAVLSAVVVTVAALSSAPQTVVDDAEALKRTVEDERSIAVAMTSWLLDEVMDAPSSSGVCEDETNDKGYLPETVTWSNCPEITHAELTKLLAPNYLWEVPEYDGWGNAYEFCLDRTKFPGRNNLGIRSPGRDGSYQRGDYDLGSFDGDDFDSDTLLFDGVFVRWPENLRLEAVYQLRSR